MSAKIRPFIFGALLMAPASFAMAQTTPGNHAPTAVHHNRPTAPAAVNTAAPAQSAAASGRQIASAAGSGVNDPTNINTPGATGRTIVPGSNSTIGGDAAATEEQRTGSYVPSE